MNRDILKRFIVTIKRIIFRQLSKGHLCNIEITYNPRTVAGIYAIFDNSLNRYIQ